MSIRVLVLGGGGGFWVGGKCRFYFYGRGDFSDVNIVISRVEGAVLEGAPSLVAFYAGSGRL